LKILFHESLDGIGFDEVGVAGLPSQVHHPVHLEFFDQAPEQFIAAGIGRHARAGDLEILSGDGTHRVAVFFDRKRLLVPAAILHHDHTGPAFLNEPQDLL